MAPGTSERPARQYWEITLTRLAPEIARDPVADAVRKMAMNVFAEYEREITELRAQRDRAYAAERERTSELRAEIARLQAELDDVQQRNVLLCPRAGMPEAMKASMDEPSGTIIRATEDPGLAFELGEDRIWRQMT